MAWSNPKTNWAAADGVTAADMNRIEANTEYLKASPVFTGAPKAAANANYGTLQFRNIYLTQTDLTPGVTPLETGAIAFVYE